MLTGESLPSTKTPLPESDIDQVQDFSIENREQVRVYLSKLFK